MEEKKDCFGFKVSGYCGALTDMVCKYRSCSFYKTKKQFIEDAKRAEKIRERNRKNHE